MSEQGFNPESENTFTPMDLPEIPAGQGGLESREPVNENPIELAKDEYLRMMRGRLEPNSESVKAFMADKGIPYETVVKVKIGEEIFNINTRESDFGTQIL